ncbi:MAG TPA: HAD family phosphatase [Actinocrinis sp.]
MNAPSTPLEPVTVAGSATAAVECRAPGGGQGGAAAFFDLDNTLIQGSSLFHLARGMKAHRFLTTDQILRFGWGQLTFRLRGERETQVATTQDRALAFAAGHTVSELTAICAAIFDEYLQAKIWPGTRALAQEHLNRGEPVWLLTAAPIELALIISGRLGLTGAMGTVAEQVDGVYTGRLVGAVLHGPAKGDAMRAIAAREGYRLAACHAYSDSANDLPMLTAVGHPHAINPDHKLRAHASERGWPTTDYRTGVRLLRIGRPAGAELRAGGSGGAAKGAAAAQVTLRRAERKLSDTQSLVVKR